MILRAEGAVYGGYVICRDGGIVFIKGAIPNEVLQVSILEKKKDYSVARVTDIIEPSGFRVNPQCEHFGVCGGCHLQFISYEKQVLMKEEVLLDSLKRIANLNTGLMPALKDKELNYRRRAQFKVSRDGRLGFYKEATRDVVPINTCLLMKEEINKALLNIKGLNLSGIKEVHITYGDILIVLIKGKGFDADLRNGFMKAGFSGIAFDDYSRSGKGYVSLDLNGITYTVSSWTFFQSNWDLNVKAVNLIKDELASLSGKKVIDLYGGAGNFSLPLTKEAREVIVIEEDQHAIKDGERNLMLNNIHNLKFLRAKSERVSLSADIVILNPPRPGLTDKVIDSVLSAGPRQVVYISCNPATLSRDLKKLLEKYELNSIRVIDFFPHTYHIESLTFLSLRV